MMTNIPIDQINNQMNPWVAIITVEEKLQAMQSPKTATRYQKFTFSDSKGAKVEGIIFDRDIERMAPKFQQYKNYRVSNADIRQQPERFARQGLKMQWVISTATVVEEILDQQSSVQLDCNYIEFDNLAQYIDDKTKRVDILGVVVDVLPKNIVTTPQGENNIQKFVLVNEQMTPIMLSMWNKLITEQGQAIIDDLRNFPVLIGRRLKTTYYNGVELSTYFDSAIHVNPPDEEAMRLKDWVAQNEKQLTDFVRNKSYLKDAPRVMIQEEKNLTTVANLLPTQKVALVKVNLSFKNILQTYWYMSCTKCYSSTAASLGYEFQCNSCGEKQLAQPRCRLELELTDQSGTINASIFGEQAEQILGLSATEARLHTANKTTPALDFVHKSLESKMFFVRIKQSRVRKQSDPQKYTIVNAIEVSKDKELMENMLVEKNVIQNLVNEEKGGDQFEKIEDDNKRNDGEIQTHYQDTQSEEQKKAIEDETAGSGRKPTKRTKTKQ